MFSLSYKSLLFLIIFISFCLRLTLIWYPNTYVFDEVYHGFTAVEYTRANPSAWDPWATPPKGVAFEWTHPPLAKELMAASLFSFRTKDPWGWRIPSVILGSTSILLVYLISQVLFKHKFISLLSAFFFSLDGLNFALSRTGMNDTYLIFFILLSLLFCLKRFTFLSAVCLGLAVASKWTGMYYAIPLFMILVYQQNLKKLISFILIPPIIYAFSYIPYFLEHFTIQQFISLQQQMWIYHTSLKATHDYASPWWSWPFNLYPVWFYVNYAQNGFIGNIFASGNPVLFALGFFAVLASAIQSVVKKSFNLLLISTSYFIFILPWAMSPRIMFLYHYAPTIPFLCIALAYQLSKLRNKQHRTYLYLALTAIIFGFVFIYPLLIGLPIPKLYLLLFFATNLAKNPFGPLN